MDNKIILHVFANLNLGGAESRIIDLYKNLNRNLVQFHFLKLTKEDCYFDDEIMKLGGEIYSITHPREGLFKNIYQYFRLIKTNKHKFHAIHFHVSYYSGFLVLISRIIGIKKLIVHSRNQSISESNKITMKLLIIMGKLLIIIFSNKLLSISEKAGLFLFSINQFINRKFIIVPNAFETENYFKNENNFIRKFRLKYKIQREDIVVGNISRLVPIKNQTFLIDIVYSAKLQNIPIKLFIIGSGEFGFEKLLVDKIKDLNLENNIYILGQKNNVNKYLQCFNVTILPSLKEGLGVVALESQAAGVPCLLSTGVPKEADIGLNLCTYLSLERDSIMHWINEIIELNKLPMPTIEERRIIFEKKGFTLNQEIKMLLKIYGISYG